VYDHTLISQTSTLNNQPSTFFYGYDGHNNVRYLTDVNGTATDTYDYDAFGNLIGQSTTFQTPTLNSYLYCGEQFDADLGLYYNRARYLNTDSGRFWTMDDFEGSQDDVKSLNKYPYAGADAINQTDPSGFDYDLPSISMAQGIGEEQDASGAEAGYQAQKSFRRQLCHISSLMMDSYNKLESLSEFGFQKHHIFQKAKFIGKGSYNPATAMAIWLLGGSASSGSPHDLATITQRNAAPGTPASLVAIDALIAAGCSPEDAKNIVTVAQQQMEDEFGIGGL
jgi:RHS repeat-associated protein